MLAVEILCAVLEAHAYRIGAVIRFEKWTIERLPSYAPRGWSWMHDECDGEESTWCGWGFSLADAWEGIEMQEGRL